MRPSTDIIHGSTGGKRDADPLTTPIYETTTFVFENAAEVQAFNEGRSKKFLYSRYGNPTVVAVEETIARIESGRVDPRVGTLDRLLEGCGFGLEHLPRLGIGIDRTTIRRLIELTPSERLELGIANDRAMVEGWRLRRVAEE